MVDGDFADLDELARAVDRQLDAGEDLASPSHWPFAAKLAGLGPGMSLLDVGCGFGGLDVFLREHGLALDYTGYELSARVVEQAQRVTPERRIVQRDILREPPERRFDVVVCYDVFGRRLARHEAYVHAMLRAMVRACELAVSVTLPLAGGAEHAPTPFYRTSPEDWFSSARRLSQHLAVEVAAEAGVFCLTLYKRWPGSVERLAERCAVERVWGATAEAFAEHLLNAGMLTELRQFLASLPPDAGVRNQEGVLCDLEGDPEGALRAFAAATALDPSEPWAYANRGALAQRQGRDAEARALYEQALARDPRNGSALAGLARLCFREGRLAEARRLVDRIQHLPWRHALAGELWQLRGKPEAALRAYERALAEAPYHLPSLIAAARLHRELGHREAALRHLKRAVLLSPADARLAAELTALQQGG